MRYNISITQDLMRNPYPGRYFAFEGIDGCGKTTQLGNIKKCFEKMGKNVVITSEPEPNGRIQEIIRDALFSRTKIPSRAYQDLYSADRCVNHHDVVIPALKRGDIVLTHRSFWSGIAYGVLDLGSKYDFSNANFLLISTGVFSNYHQFLAPDMCFYIRVSVKHAVRRLEKMTKTKDIYENETKLAKIVTGYEYIVRKFEKEFIIINGERSEEEVTRQIVESIK